ncbi:MAG: NAD(P)/FAD-dependent oxidoreductase [Bacilli bacterium]
MSEFVHYIKNINFLIISKGSLNECFVTGGGINLKEINSRTMQSKFANNIYFIGEVLDIHGPMSGYNLTICFVTRKCAADNINNS